MKDKCYVEVDSSPCLRRTSPSGVRLGSGLAYINIWGGGALSTISSSTLEIINNAYTIFILVNGTKIIL